MTVNSAKAIVTDPIDRGFTLRGKSGRENDSPLGNLERLLSTIMNVNKKLAITIRKKYGSLEICQTLQILIDNQNLRKEKVIRVTDEFHQLEK